MLDPTEYVLKKDTGYIFKVAKDDPIRKRVDMRLPTEEELRLFFGIAAPEVEVEEPVKEEEPVKKRAGRPRKNTIQVKFYNDDVI